MQLPIYDPIPIFTADRRPPFIKALKKFHMVRWQLLNINYRTLKKLHKLTLIQMASVSVKFETG